MHVDGAGLESTSLGVGGATPRWWAEEASQARQESRPDGGYLLPSGHPLSVVS